MDFGAIEGAVWRYAEPVTDEGDGRTADTIPGDAAVAGGAASGGRNDAGAVARDDPTEAQAVPGAGAFPAGQRRRRRRSDKCE